MSSPADAPTRPWHADVTRYQWLVLLIASAGWIFDAFEGQLFGVTRADVLGDILKARQPELDAKALADEVKRWGDIMLALFQLGGTLGGWFFSSLADRWGRKPVMSLTILFYSLFSGLTWFATDLWHVGLLRFFVAMGVGGEWAVAAALVAEVFPARARAQASSLFHSSSIMGTWLAAAVGLLVGSNWRLGYVLSVIPALLVLWVRASVREPETWQQAKLTHQDRMGSYRELLTVSPWRQRSLAGMALATVGMATFWGVTVAGLDLMRELCLRQGMDAGAARAEAQFAYAYVQGSGAALGMLLFGPISARLGRRRTFVLYHLGALLTVPVVCWLPQTPGQMWLVMPLLGFFTLGIHAGYAVYFPELFPDHLRATGAGFCFNTGRLISALVLWLSGMLKAAMSLPAAITMLAGFFLLGLLVLQFLPETKDKPLPE